MQAIVLDTDDQFRVTELDEPTPGPGEVAIQVTYAGIQWGDVLIREGRFPVPRPFPAGFEASGHIIAAGEGVDPRRVGEPVAALTMSGAYAEVVVVPAAFAYAVGDLPLAQAAGFGWGTPTAYDLIHTVARVQPGESVLIHSAAGGVGTVAVQIAKLAGAGRIVGVVGSSAKVGYAVGFGYDEVVPAADFPAALGEARFDVILDPVGGQLRKASLDLLAPHGRLVAFGNADGDDAAISTTDLVWRNISVLGYSSFALVQSHPERFAASASRALELLTSGQVRADITAEYELDDLDTAVRRMADRSTIGKALLRIAPR